jgi:hypothetical protein
VTPLSDIARTKLPATPMNALAAPSRIARTPATES